VGETLRQWLDSVLGKALAVLLLALGAGLTGGQLERLGSRAELREEVENEVGTSIDQLEAEARSAAEKLEKRKAQLREAKSEALDWRAVLDYLAAKYETEQKAAEARYSMLAERCLPFNELATDSLIPEAAPPAPPVEPPTVSRKVLDALPLEQRALIPEVQAKE
jgi:vacuolar-type H+-ATPase subunit I/STV1